MSTMEKVAIAEFAKEVVRPVKLEPAVSYRSIGVKWYGEGVHVHEEKEGQLFEADRYEIAADDIIYNDMWARKGSVAIVPPQLSGAVASPHFPTFRVDQSRAVPSFLSWYFRTPSFWADCEDASRGSTGRNQIKRKTFLAISVPLPSLGEQRRVVARIERLSMQVLDAARLRREASRELDELPGQYIEMIFKKGHSEGWLPGQLGDYVIDASYGTSEKASDDATGTPVLRMGNIQKGRLELGSLKYLHLNDNEKKKLLLRRGDIIVNRTNSAELVGKCAVFELESEYAFASYLIRLRLDLKRANPRLVAAYINSPVGRAYMFDERKQMTGQANVNSKKLNALPIALPSLVEQDRIVSQLEVLKASAGLATQLQNQTGGELSAMLPAILDKAFRGEL